MRTPWRFVADLVSRKSKPESAAVAAKTIALEYKPVPEGEQLGTEPAAVDRQVESGPEAQPEASPSGADTASTDTETATSVVTQAPARPVGNEEPTPLLTPRQPKEKSPASTQTEAAEEQVKPAPALRAKAKHIVQPVVSVIQTKEVGPAIAAGPKSFLDEMADLDAEVGALRRQLAEKLNEQNAQLRKMLARFNAG